MRRSGKAPSMLPDRRLNPARTPSVRWAGVASNDASGDGSGGFRRSALVAVDLRAMGASYLPLDGNRTTPLSSRFSDTSRAGGLAPSPMPGTAPRDQARPFRLVGRDDSDRGDRARTARLSPDVEVNHD